jgi:predicted nucleic acid-binding protein
VTIDNALKDVARLAFDTVSIIYFIEKHPTYIVRMRDILSRVDAGKIQGMVSTIALAEVLVHPAKKGDQALARQYERLLTKSKNMHLISVDTDVARNTAELRAEYSLKTPDALHVAAAIHGGADAFLTNDRGLRRITAIDVLILEDLTL